MTKNLRSRFVTSVILCFLSFFSSAQKKVVILGSSTAAGSGASSYANAWVGKYSTYIAGFGHTLTNLAVGGYNTYNILPTGTLHTGRPGQDPARNITAAIADHDADVVIVNMPSNDVANSYDVSETLLNYRRIKAYCDSAKVSVYFTTTQPRNFTDLGKLGQLMQIRDSTFTQYGNFVIDFWNGIANADGTIMPAYNADGIHVNDPAHEIFFQRVKAKQIVGPITVLPVSIKGFRALSNSSGVHLTWELNITGTDRSLQEIQRSADGVSFVSVGTLPVSISESFSFVDRRPLSPVNYYRVKVSTSSSLKYSDVLRVLAEDTKSGIGIFPNPVSGRMLRLQFRQASDEQGTMVVYNAAATEVFRQCLLLKRGWSTYSLQLPNNLQSGVYYVNIAGRSASKQQVFLLQ